MDSILAQNPALPIVMHTGSGNVQQTQSFSYNSSAVGSGLLTIDFGMATAEQPQPGQFADAFTISLSGPGGIAYLVTADASGPVWNPSVPGALSLLEGSLHQASTSFLAPSEGLLLQQSFELGYLLPNNWLGVPLQINFDLFDNQNQQPSLAYYAVVVPEPGTVALWLLGLSWVGMRWQAMRLWRKHH